MATDLTPLLVLFRKIRIEQRGIELRDRKKKTYLLNAIVKVFCGC